MASAILKQKNLTKKTFNVVASGLFKELSKLFPTHPTLLFLAGELERLSKDRQNAHVPAVKFFKSANSSSGVPSLAVEEGSSTSTFAPVGELVINRDERLFYAPDAVVPGLEAVNFKELWPLLSPENKARVWDYLNRMAELSARVATMEALNLTELSELTQLATASSSSSSSAPQMPKTQEEVERILKENPALVALSQRISERLCAGSSETAEKRVEEVEKEGEGDDQ
jgi:hypothetical protein